MIEKGKIAVAEKLLNMVMNDSRTEIVEGYVEMFENCREQGYRIIFDDNNLNSHTIAFSENRNSDDIVVYFSNKYESLTFEYSDEFWDSRKFFNYNDFEGVTEYIISTMLEEVGVQI